MKAKSLFASTLLSGLMALPFSNTNGAPRLGADLVIINAVVRTMDAERPAAEAVAIAAGRIAAVGS